MVNELTCGFCGLHYYEDQAQPTCSGCPLKGGCQLARCPHCGYENPLEPGWVTRLRGWLRADARASHTLEARADTREDAWR